MLGDDSSASASWPNNEWISQILQQFEFNMDLMHLHQEQNFKLIWNLNSRIPAHTQLRSSTVLSVDYFEFHLHPKYIICNIGDSFSMRENNNNHHAQLVDWRTVITIRSVHRCFVYSWLSSVFEMAFVRHNEHSRM